MTSRYALKNNIKNERSETISSDNHHIEIAKNQEENLTLKIVNNNSTITIDIKENAHVKVLLLSYNQQKVDLNVTVNLQRNATFGLITGLSNNESRLMTQVYLNGEGASATIDSLIVGKAKEHQKAYFEIINNAINTSGNINSIGIASENSRVTVDGIGRINKGMHDSKNYQHLTGINFNAATIEMNPYLLIDEHDVEAGHGATIGQMDNEVLYYLMSRGIPKEVAEDLYTKGIVAPFIDQIFNLDLCEKFNQYLWGVEK